MAGLSLPPLAAWLIVIAVALLSINASFGFLSRQTHAISSVSAAAPGRSLSIPPIEKLPPGSISAIAPLPARVVTPEVAAALAAETATAVVEKPARPRRTVLGDGLNVRMGPSGSSRKMGAVRGGEQVAVLAEEGGWVRIEWSGTSGWVYEKYLAD